MSRLQVPDVPEQSNRRWKKIARYGNRIRREATRHLVSGTEPRSLAVKVALDFLLNEAALDWERKMLANAI